MIILTVSHCVPIRVEILYRDESGNSLMVGGSLVRSSADLLSPMEESCGQKGKGRDQLSFATNLA